MGATKPVVAVDGRVVMGFTSEQVRVMAEEASLGSGLRGGALDAADPVHAGTPPLSYLLAAWVSSGSSAGAAEVRSLMGRQDWSAAPRLSFPVVALPLFTADVIGAVHAGSPAALATSRLIGSAPRQVRLVNFINSPCSTVTGFIDDFMSTVFAALTLTEPEGATLGTKVGRFFVETWNTAVSYAQKAVHGLLKTVTEAVLTQIENEAAAAAVIAEVITNVSPWTATVTALPSSIALGDTGSFKAKVSSALAVDDYPAPMKDCADKLGFTLPSLNAKGASAKWSLSSPLSPTSATSVDLDDNAASTISYKTEPKSSAGGGSCSGGSPSSPTPGTESAVGSITVTRPAVGDLKGLLANLLSTNIPVVGGIVHRLLKPLIDEVLSRLDTLSQVTGSAKVAITPSRNTGGAGGSCPPTHAGACLVGDWTVTSLTFDPHVAAAYSGGAGTEIDIAADGTAVIDFTPGGALVSAGSGRCRPYQWNRNRPLGFLPQHQESRWILLRDHCQRRRHDHLRRRSAGRFQLRLNDRIVSMCRRRPHSLVPRRRECVGLQNRSRQRLLLQLPSLYLRGSLRGVGG